MVYLFKAAKEAGLAPHNVLAALIGLEAFKTILQTGVASFDTFANAKDALKECMDVAFTGIRH